MVETPGKEFIKKLIRILTPYPQQTPDEGSPREVKMKWGGGMKGVLGLNPEWTVGEDRSHSRYIKSIAIDESSSFPQERMKTEMHLMITHFYGES